MKFRQAKKIMWGTGSSVRDKYRRRRPPYQEYREDLGKYVTCYPSLHDVDIIARARVTFLHHIKRKKKKWN